MADLQLVLGGPWTPPAPLAPKAPEDQLIESMLEAGLTPPDHVILDGRMHRFSNGKKDKTAWYIAFSDNVPSGRFGCWRSGIDVSWRADIGRRLTPIEEMTQATRTAEARAIRDAEIAKAREIAADTVEQIWSSCVQATADHPYLSKKGVQAHGARVTGDGRLVVPLFDSDGDLSTLQYISADGGKMFHPGGQAGGRFWMLGAVDSAGPLYVVEGFATAATINEATGMPCVAAYSASNIVPVVATLRKAYGAGQEIVIVADHDAHGVGKKFADEAAAKHGATVILPPIDGMDANDYAQAGHDLSALLNQAAPSGLLEKLGVIFGDELGDDYEAPNELIEGLMTIGGLTVIYGDSNSGKTFFALSMAAAIATGTDFYGRKVDPGLAIYLACEAPVSIRSRLQALKKFYGCSLENLAIVQVPLNFYESDAHVVDVIAMVREVEQIKGKKAHCLFGDTLARMSAGANENSGEDMGPVMARFDKVALATKAAMTIIHHNGKNAAAGARGWSGIRAHIDTEIEVTEKDGTRSATITKQRELPGKGESIYFRLEIVEMGVSKFGSTATTCVAVPDEDAAEKRPHEKPSKHTEHVRTLERAWWESGREVRGEYPYVSRSALRELLIKDGMKERTAKNKTESGRSDGMIAPLLNGGVIETYEHGWIFVNDAQASAMLLRRNAK